MKEPIGQKITAIRKMTEEEIDITFGIERYFNSEVPDCIELENGDIILPSRDYEGNGPGVFFAVSDEKSYGLTSTE